ncbi:hypothetical protein EXIGLDRAFT_703066 [Exidia glandulosa HHB12029]|uniref:Ricin B lectin domain-containing protein n=1 Tax=Exidia glandulosa HHB12029 TaxID=1314781 RepID=A0A165C8B5_EXIGL|nr:hypothetical protein EXIGLDRAFT_703066 [Exidia glandulosa HHB12029]
MSLLNVLETSVRIATVVLVLLTEVSGDEGMINPLTNVTSFVGVKGGAMPYASSADSMVYWPHIVVSAERNLLTPSKLHNAQTFAVADSFVGVAAVLPPTGNFRIFNTNSTGGRNVFDVGGADMGSSEIFPSSSWLTYYGCKALRFLAEPLYVYDYSSITLLSLKRASSQILAQFNNPVPANSLNQQWIATQAFLNGVNLYSFISLERFNPIGTVYFGVSNPAAGAGAIAEGTPTFFTLNETSPAVYTEADGEDDRIRVANTNLTLTATNAPTNQIVVQPFNATNTLQHWQFTAVA